MPGKRYASVQANTILLLLAAVARLGLSFWFLTYLSRAFGGGESTRNFGIYALVVQYFELCVSLSSTAVGILLTREIARRPARLPIWLSHAMVLTLTLVGASQFAIFVICPFVYSANVMQLMVLSAVATVPAAMGCLFEACFVGLERARYVTFGTLIDCMLRYGGGGLALFLGHGLPGVFVALVASRAVMLTFYWVALRQYVQFRWVCRASWMRQLLRRWWVFAGENWLATFYSTLDVLILSYFRTEAVVGLYSAGLRLVRLASTTIRCYTLAVFPVLSRLHRTCVLRFRELHLASLRMMLAVTLPAALVITLYAEQVIALVFGDEFLPASNVLRVVIWAMVFESVNPFLSHTLFARDAQASSFRVAIVGFTTRLTALLALVPLFGMVGTAWATVISGYLATLCYCYFVLTPADAKRLAFDLARTTAALGGLAAVLLVTPSTDWMLGVAIGSVLYAFLLFALRVVRLADLQLNQG